MRRLFFTTLIILLLALSAAAIPTKKVQADSDVTAYDLIAMVNSIRTSQFGLPALVENQYLDNSAQWTAETMASINAENHLAFLGYDGASVRAANFGFGGGKTVFVTENWYMGNNPTLNQIQTGWNDEQHMYPMDKAQYTYVGAGTATASNGWTYYVLQAGYISGETAATSQAIGGNSSSGTVSTPGAADLSNWVAAVYTSTPSPDGMIYHKVQANQMLSNIAAAYGVTVAYLVELNNLSSPDSIYAGQVLTIKTAPTATITPTMTPTAVYPTDTPTPFFTATPYMTPTPTPRPSLLSQLPKFDRQTFGLLLVIVSAIGLALVVFLNFIKSAKRGTKPTESTPENILQKPVGQAPASRPGIAPAAKKPAATKEHKPLDIPVKTSRRTTKK